MGISQPNAQPGEGGRSRWLHRFALLTAGCTFGLIFVGGLVTSTGSGLAVPDWPLAFGQFFPPMVGGVLIEHGHRLVAGFVGILTVALTVWVCLKEPRKWVRGLALAALGAIVLQGLLGGVTVLLELPTAVSVSHALLAQAFFCLTVALAMVTNPKWSHPSRSPRGEATSSMKRLCMATTAVVFLQLLLGAWMRHIHAGLAIPDFPLAFGRLAPPLALLKDPRVTVHFLHRLGAVAVAGFVLWTVTLVLRRYPDEPRLIRPAGGLVALLAFQLVLGALTIWTSRAVVPTTAHVAVGAAVLAVTLVLTLRFQERQPARAGAKARPWLTEEVPAW
ncbi:MAG: heme A synthase [Nitrospinota bacterium]